MKKIFFLILIFSSITNCYCQTVDDYIENGEAKSLLGQDQGAIVDFNKALEIDAKNARAYAGRGTAKSNLEDYRGAIADLNKAIEYNNDNLSGIVLSLIYNNRGSCKGSLKNNQGALDDFGLAILFNPKGASAYYNRGIARLKLNQKENGCLDLSKAGELGFSGAYKAIQDYCN